MAMPNKKGSKSHKSDGTPKKRWTAAERSARGHAPRRRGGQDRPREDRVESVADRDDRRSGDRRGSFRDDRGGYNEARGGFRGDRDERRFDDRRGGFRDDRGGNRDERRDFRDDRGGFRGDRRGSFRDDRGSFRDDRGSFRDDRRGNRDDRGGFRGDRRGSFRDDRGSFRDDRGSFRDDRGSFRDDRGGNRDDRRGFRDDRGGFREDQEDRRYGDRPARDRGQGGQRRGPARDFNDYGARPRRHGQRDFRESQDFGRQAPESDQMSWDAAEALDVEVTAADQASGFAELGIALPVVAALSAKGITEPFPIQSATIGDALAGRDVLGRARTGSGKTLAFGLPLLTQLADTASQGSPRAMILTPTRELALQIADNLAPLAATVGLDLTLIAGGMSYGPQIRAFERGVDVLVATPGRLIDLLEQGVADLSGVRVTVLDEADHMCDLGFLGDVRTLLDAVPADGQRLLFSATLDDAVASLVKAYLHDPVTHEIDSGQGSVATMTHRFLELAPHHKNAITAEIANRDGKTLVFARTQMGADRIAAQLREAGVLAGALHGGLTQGARARVLAAYKSDALRVLVATDVAARGIHVDDITLVLQVDPPMGPKDYLHRAGRTARAGESGTVVSIVLPHQRKLVRRLAGQAGIKVAATRVEPGSPELREATGARPPSGTPIADEDYQAIIAPKPQQKRRPQGGRPGGFRGDRRGGSRGYGHRRDRW